MVKSIHYFQRKVDLKIPRKIGRTRCQTLYHTHTCTVEIETNSMIKVVVLLLITCFLLQKERKIGQNAFKGNFHQKLSTDQDKPVDFQSRSLASNITTEFPRRTIMPIWFLSPALVISIASSKTRFMKGSKPRRIPSIARPPLIFNWIYNFKWIKVTRPS